MECYDTEEILLKNNILTFSLYCLSVYFDACVSDRPRGVHKILYVVYLQSLNFLSPPNENRRSYDLLFPLG